MAERLAIDRKGLQAWQGLKQVISTVPSLEQVEFQFRPYVHQTIDSFTHKDCGPTNLLEGFWWAIEKIEETIPTNPLNQSHQIIPMPSFTEPIIITPATTFGEIIYSANLEHKPACDYVINRAHPQTLLKIVNLAALFAQWRQDIQISKPFFRQKIQKNSPLINKWLTYEIEERESVPLMRLAVVNRWLGKQCKVTFPDLNNPSPSVSSDQTTRDMEQENPDFNPMHRITLAELAEIRRKLAREANPRTY